MGIKIKHSQKIKRIRTSFKEFQNNSKSKFELNAEFKVCIFFLSMTEAF